MRQRIIFRVGVLLLGVLAMLAAVPIIGFGDVPQQVNYQGRLTDDVGNPLDGNFVMVFSIYDVASEGTALWWEDQTVALTGGIYNVQIGQDPTGNPFPSGLFDGQRWLGVTVGADAEMTPRHPLTSTPFTLRAETVVDGAISTVHLSDNAVTSEKVVDGAVTSAKIADGSVTATDIYDGSGSGLDADRLDGLEASDFAAASTLAQLEARIAQLEALLANVTRPGVDTIRFSNVNVQIVNGTGTMAGTGNGRGNLIVGYNENTVAASRTGSHNLVIGIDHGYTSYAGFLAGRHNKISGTSSSVMGYGNEVTASYSSVSGGYFNTASGIYSSVSGGYANTTSAAYASVSGGRDNTAGGNYASISGGRNNEASGMSSFVAGGGGANDIDGNIAFADFSAILGGLNNLTGDGSCVWDLDAGRFVCTGGSDHTIGLQARMSGGRNNTASGDTSSISGGYVNTASGLYSNVGKPGRTKLDY